MNKSAKRLVYFFILVILPASVILFLRFFGENRFDLPVYYQDTVPALTNCSESVAPHKVVIEELEAGSYGSLATIVAFLESPRNAPELTRIEELMKGSDVINIVTLSKAEGVGIKLSSETFDRYLECQFFYSDLKNRIEETEDRDIDLPLFLLDKERTIRGLYIGEDKIDIDRLITEVEIMKKYNGNL